MQVRLDEEGLGIGVKVDLLAHVFDGWVDKIGACVGKQTSLSTFWERSFFKHSLCCIDCASQTVLLGRLQYRR